MKAPKRSAEHETLHPRENPHLFGHAAAERAFLDAFRGGRLHHAWLIAGPQGIGKATFAYRAARFVLAHPGPGAQAVRDTADLAVPPDHPTARRMTAQGHSDLLVIERGLNDAGNLRANIAVDDVRRTTGFFGSTAGEGGWRVCIVDAADDLNAAGANALLKMVEEPPRRALFLLVTRAPGRLLPTIRSRCRTLRLSPLATDDVARVLAAVVEPQPAPDEIARAAAFGDGSVGKALTFLDPDIQRLRGRIDDLLGALPKVDPAALHTLGDALGGPGSPSLPILVDAARDWLSSRLRAEAADLPQLARLGEVWDKINTTARDVELYNLEPKPLAFAMFDLLASAARR